jgi:hypothetical protein
MKLQLTNNSALLMTYKARFAFFAKRGKLLGIKEKVGCRGWFYRMAETIITLSLARQK